MEKSEAALVLREALGALGDDAKNILSEALGAAGKHEDQRVRASEPVSIYALKDIGAGEKGAIGPDGKIVHARGSAQQVPPVDAREIVRSGLYGYSPPGPERVAAPLETAAAKPVDNGKAAPAAFALTSLPNVNSKLARVLEDAKGEDGQSLNLATLEGFRAVKAEVLAGLPGVGAKMADILKAYVTENFKEE